MVASFCTWSNISWPIKNVKFYPYEDVPICLWGKLTNSCSNDFSVALRVTSHEMVSIICILSEAKSIPLNHPSFAKLFQFLLPLIHLWPPGFHSSLIFPYIFKFWLLGSRSMLCDLNSHVASVIGNFFPSWNFTGLAAKFEMLYYLEILIAMFPEKFDSFSYFKNLVARLQVKLKLCSCFEILIPGLPVKLKNPSWLEVLIAWLPIKLEVPSLLEILDAGLPMKLKISSYIILNFWLSDRQWNLLICFSISWNFENLVRNFHWNLNFFISWNRGYQFARKTEFSPHLNILVTENLK